ncbi:MAG TPA: TonB-dependent receptor plug domain-containing protein, partial [Roseivirga sp.]
MIRSFAIFLCLFTLQNAYGQRVRVIDEKSRQPIELVTIQERGTDRGAVTDKTGYAELKGFSTTGQLILRHPTYRPKLIKFSSIEKAGFVIALEEAINEIDDVVVSANRWEQDKEEIPQQIAEFKASEIALAEPATAADVLSMNSQVFVQKSQQGGGSPMIRGFSANSVLLVIDGVRMNNAIYRSGNLQNVISLDPANLQDAEVVFGPSTVVYGSDALGGVMDFHTKSPAFSTDYLGISSKAHGRYASANNALSGNYQIEFNLPKFASFSSLSYSKFDDLRTGSQRTDKFPDFGKRLEYIVRQGNSDIIVQNDNVNLQRDSGYDQYNFLQKFRWKLGSFSEFSYSFHHSSSSDIPRYDRLIERSNGQLRHAAWYYGPQLWQMHSLQSKFFYPNRFFNELKVTTAFQFVEESRNDRRYQSEILRTRKEKVDVLS